MPPSPSFTLPLEAISMEGRVQYLHDLPLHVLARLVPWGHINLRHCTLQAIIPVVTLFGTQHQPYWLLLLTIFSPALVTRPHCATISAFLFSCGPHSLMLPEGPHRSGLIIQAASRNASRLVMSIGTGYPRPVLAYHFFEQETRSRGHTASLSITLSSCQLCLVFRVSAVKDCTANPYNLLTGCYPGVSQHPSLRRCHEHERLYCQSAWATT